MKHLCLIALCALALIRVDCSEHDLASTIASFGPRLEGSPGEAGVFDYIERRLRAAGLAPASAGFDALVQGNSSSRILEARLAGALDDELAIIVPVNSWADSVQAREGCEGIALLMAQAERLSAAAAAGRLPPISLRFVFLGAERRGPSYAGEEASLGSRSWIAQNRDRKKIALLYLALDTRPTSLVLRNSGPGMVSPLWFFSAGRRALKDAAIPGRLGLNAFQLYGLGSEADYGPVSAYLDAGFPALELRGEAGTSPAPDGAWFDRFIDSLLLQNAQGFSLSGDRHYLVLQIGGLNVVLSEKVSLATLFAFWALAAILFLSMSLVRGGRIALFLRSLPLSLGRALVVYATLVAVFFLAVLQYHFESLVLGSAQAWMLAPRWFLACRLALIFFTFLGLLFFLVERRLLSTEPFFYEFAALLCLGIDVLVVSAFRLPLSFLFVWAFLIVALSLGARSRRMSLAAYALMYLPFFFLLADLFLRPELSVYRFILVPGAGTVFFLSAAALPFFAFGVSPFLAAAPRESAARKRAALVCLLCAGAVELALLSVALAGPAARARVGRASADFSLTEIIEQDRGSFSASLSAKRRLGSSMIARGGLKLPYSSAGDRVLLHGADSEQRLRWTGSQTVFLDRATLLRRLSFAAAPYSLELTLRSDKGLELYDCNLPYRSSLDGKSIELFAPVNPGTTLSIELTVPRSFEARLEVAAIYLRSPVPYTFADGGSPGLGHCVIRSSVPVSGVNGP